MLGPIPQDPAYHNFTDRRSLLGIPNFGNVASNLPFIGIGALGLILLSRRDLVRPEGPLLSYIV